MQTEDKKKFKQEFTQRAYRFGLNIIRTIEKLDMKDMTSKIIGNQLIRSGTSIAANIIEAKGSSSKKDYANFFSHALKSANETIYWITLLKDAGKIGDKTASELIQEGSEIAKILAKSIMTMRSKS